MTAAELVEMLPEFPDALAVRSAKDDLMLICFHRLPVSGTERIRIAWGKSQLVGYYKEINHTTMLLSYREPFELLARQRIELHFPEAL